MYEHKSFVVEDIIFGDVWASRLWAVLSWFLWFIVAVTATTILLVTGLVMLILIKSLLTPQESNPSKLFFGLFPVPRWMTKSKRAQNQSRTSKEILLLTYGTRGDVQPLVALAQELDNYRVGQDDDSFHPYHATVCTADEFSSFVTSHNVAFVSCGVARVEQPAFLFDAKQASSFAKIIQVLADVYPPLACGMWLACDRVKPDLIISQAVVRGIGAQCAEKLGVAHWSCHFAPSNTPTFAFPPPEYKRSTLPILNKWKYLDRNLRIALAAVRSGLGKADEAFRLEVLGFAKPLDVTTMVADLDKEPSIHAYSPVLQPKPKDWARWVQVVGPFTMPPCSSTSEKKPQISAVLNAGLEAFLSKSRPVYVGFGSMQGAERQRNACCAVARMLNRQVLLFTERNPRGLVDDNLLEIGPTPHDVLFPRCALIIHHGGAGTTNAAIAAGVPQLIIPILAWSDQPFWGDVVQRQGVGRRFDFDAQEEDDLEQLRIVMNDCLLSALMTQKAIALKHAQHPNGTRAVLDLVIRYFEQVGTM